MFVSSVPPAIRVLHDSGIYAAEVARRLDVSPQSVRYWLACRVRPRPKLWGLLADLVGPEVATKVRAAVFEREGDH